MWGILGVRILRPLFANSQLPVLFLVIEGRVTSALQVRKLLCTSSGKECRLLLVFVLVIVSFEQLEGGFSCALHFWIRALKHVKLGLLVPSIARAFSDFVGKIFLTSSVEPTIEIFFDICVLSISEFVMSFVEALPVDGVVIVFGLGLVLLQEEFDVVL